jgi:hypothetical protein
LDAMLQQREKDTFAGLWVQHTPTFRVIVQFTDQGPKDVAKYLPDPSLAPYIDIRRANMSYDQLISTQRHVVMALRGRKFDSGINIPANQVEVYVRDEQPLLHAFIEASFPIPANTQLVPVTELSRDEAQIYGGVAIRGCTAGWSVRNSAGATGIATAAHCGNTQSYKGVSLPFVAQKYGGSCDVQWHKDGSHTAVAKFVADNPSAPRVVSALRSRANQAVGSYVCKRGKTTGYTCGYITDKNFRPNHPNGTATFIRVHRDNVNLSDPGDSGGPWFNTNTAYGVHKCGIGANDSCYMAIDYVSSCLGVTVVTQ